MFLILKIIFQGLCQILQLKLRDAKWHFISKLFYYFFRGKQNNLVNFSTNNQAGFYFFISVRCVTSVFH
ncbi:hypothetical protein CNR22_14420 [Sphingobacteriaceae bacterium]|nr:hypothetical protein CNR22_14420 [Sphingobacteriaceae bacterium]